MNNHTLEEHAYVSGDTRGAHLKLAQRHHKIVAGQFRGRRQLEPEFAHPGVIGQLALSFTPSTTLPKESRVTCVLPNHGWAFPSSGKGTSNGINAVLVLPQGLPTSALRTTFDSGTRTLEFTLVNEEIPAQTPVVVLVSGVATPESATPSADVTVTSYEKLIVRNTAPPSTRGGQVLDGPSVFMIPSIAPGEITGVKKWQPFSCCPRSVSDVTLSVTVHGRVPLNGKILVELPADGWDMDDSPRVLLRTAEYHNVPLSALWRRDRNTLEIQLGVCSIKQGTSLILTVCGVKNPEKETIHTDDRGDTSSSSIKACARITTLVASGGVIDGPTTISVASISELREIDFRIAKQAFDELRLDGQQHFVPVDKLPDLLRRTGIVLTPEQYQRLVVASLPVRSLPEPVAATTPLECDPPLSPSSPCPQANEITRDEFLNLFAQVYAPTYKYSQELRLASGRNELDRIDELIRRGCDANSKDGSGWTALHYGADYGHLASIECIAAAIAAVKSESTNPESTTSPFLEVNVRDLHGWTPLLCAAANGHTDVVNTLLKMGADLSIATSQGRTAVHWAATRGMAICLEALLAAGAQKDAVDVSGWTALHCASLHGNDSCVKILVDYGAKQETKDNLLYAYDVYSGSASTATPASPDDAALSIAVA